MIKAKSNLNLVLGTCTGICFLTREMDVEMDVDMDMDTPALYWVHFFNYIFLYLSSPPNHKTNK